MNESYANWAKIVALCIVVTVVLLAIIVALTGFGSIRGQSEYTGHVVDVVEDKGVVFRPTWVNMKTDPRSSDIQQYCVLPDDEREILPEFYDAMESGDRVTVTYERPLWVNPNDCNGSQSIITDVRYANETS